MVWPDYVPIFTANDMIDPPPTEYEIGRKKSFIGWLKHLFLYYTDPEDKDCIQIRPEDRKNYEKVLDIVKKECKIKDIHHFEDTTTRKSQAATLNKVCRKLGYKHEV